MQGNPVGTWISVSECFILYDKVEEKNEDYNGLAKKMEKNANFIIRRW